MSFLEVWKETTNFMLSIYIPKKKQKKNDKQF